MFKLWLIFIFNHVHCFVDYVVASPSVWKCYAFLPIRFELVDGANSDRPGVLHGDLTRVSISNPMQHVSLVQKYLDLLYSHSIKLPFYLPCPVKKTAYLFSSLKLMNCNVWALFGYVRNQSFIYILANGYIMISRQIWYPESRSPINMLSNNKSFYKDRVLTSLVPSKH